MNIRYTCIALIMYDPLMAVVLGIRPPICLQVGALFIILLSPDREGGGGSDFHLYYLGIWREGGGGLGGLISRHSWSSIL